MQASEIGGRLGAHREHLWRVCYRMTGSAADADDLVQDTFARALELPPADLVRDLRPWLVRVAINLSRDALRARKRRAYVGTWLPSPIDTPATLSETVRSAETRYGEVESLGFAFLRALEALSPTQRAVLILRDVLDYSVRETAATLELGEPNVKTTLHRARKAMAAYGAEARPSTRAEQARTRAKLEAFCLHLLAHNVSALEALLADDVRAHNDGAGEFFAARKPVVGKAKVIKFHLRVGDDSRVRFAVRMINGMPALVGERIQPRKGVPPRFVMFVVLDAAGRISSIDTVVATRKLSAVRFDGLTFTGGGDLARALRAAATNPPLREWAAPLARRAAGAAVSRARRWLQARKRKRTPRS